MTASVSPRFPPPTPSRVWLQPMQLASPLLTWTRKSTLMNSLQPAVISLASPPRTTSRLAAQALLTSLKTPNPVRLPSSKVKLAMQVVKTANRVLKKPSWLLVMKSFPHSPLTGTATRPSTSPPISSANILTSSLSTAPMTPCTRCSGSR